MIRTFIFQYVAKFKMNKITIESLIWKIYQIIWGREAKLEGMELHCPQNLCMHLLTLIMKFIRNTKKSMIRGSQIFNLYSGGLRKKMTFENFRIFFSGKYPRKIFDYKPYIPVWLYSCSLQNFLTVHKYLKVEKFPTVKKILRVK